MATIAAEAEYPSYSLVVNDGGIATRRIEFAGTQPYAAMDFAQRELAEQNIEVFKDGRSLAKMRCTRDGFWTVFPRSPARQ